MAETARLGEYYRSITQETWRDWARGQQELYHKDILTAYLAINQAPPIWLVLNKTAEDREAERKITWRDYTTDLIKNEQDMTKVAGILGLYAGTQSHSLRDSREAAKKLLKALNRAQTPQEKSDIVSDFFDDYQFDGRRKYKDSSNSYANRGGSNRSGSKNSKQGGKGISTGKSSSKGFSQSNSYRGQNPNLGK